MFKPAKMQWKGETILIGTPTIMLAVAAAEEHLTIHELMRFAQRRTQPFARISMAFTAALSVAGHTVEPTDVYRSLVQGDPDDVMQAVSRLLAMMEPPEEVTQGNGEAPRPGAKKSTAGDKRRSRRRTS